MTPTRSSATIAALSKLPYARCTDDSAPMTSLLTKKHYYKQLQPGLGEILVGPVEPEFQGRLGSSYDAGLVRMLLRFCVRLFEHVLFAAIRECRMRDEEED